MLNLHWKITIKTNIQKFSNITINILLAILQVVFQFLILISTNPSENYSTYI